MKWFIKKKDNPKYNTIKYILIRDDGKYPFINHSTGKIEFVDEIDLTQQYHDGKYAYMATNILSDCHIKSITLNYDNNIIKEESQ